MATTSRIAGFRTLSPSERRQAVADSAGLGRGVLDPFTSGGLTVDAACQMSENVIGVIGLPVGIATNMIVNGKEVLVPMATEEASVVAAASNGARMARTLGGFRTTSSPSIMQAQIQVVDVADPHAARLRLLEGREDLIALAERQDPMLVELGGGVRDIVVRTVDGTARGYVVVHLIVDVRDAMGANAVNTMAEAVAGRVAELAGGRVVLRILTNKADQRLARARAVLDVDTLGGPGVAEDIVHAAALAEADPYRAVTHNKGIMNGITAVVLATGNDTRAVEAGAHSHAVNAEGRYTALSSYELDADGNVAACLELPMPIGIVGGATKSHPAARAAGAVTEVSSASELAELIVAVGLAQNIAALRALAVEGIQRGHMSLHAKNLAVAVGAQGEEIRTVARLLVTDRAIRHDHAAAVLAELRSGTNR